MMHSLESKLWTVEENARTGCAIEVEEAAAGKVDELLALAVEVEGDLLGLSQI